MVWPVLLYAVALPLLASGLLMLVPPGGVGRILARSEALKQEDAQRGAEAGKAGLGAPPADWRPAVALATAYLIAHFGLHGRPVGAQLESWEWLLALIPLAALTGVVLQHLPWIAAKGILLAGLAAVTAWLATPSFQQPWWTWWAVMGASVALLSVMQLIRCSSPFLALTWVLVGSCGLPVLIASANAKFGFFSTSLAAGSGALFLATLVRRRAANLSAAVPVASVLVPVLYWNGYFNDYGDVPVGAFVCLVAAPIGFALSGVIRAPRWLSVVGGLTVTALLCAAAVYFAWPALTAEPAY